MATASVIPDQAQRLREMTAAAPLPAPRPATDALTIAVASGKGGVGKTNLAVNLSVCLAARGLRVCLLDADLGLANADLLLDVRCPYNLSHVIAGLRPIEEVGVRAGGGVLFVPGASGLEECANLSEFQRQQLLTQLQRVSRQSDVQLIDCGAGIARNVLTFALASDLVMLITTPEPTAMTDAYALLKVLQRNGRTAPVSLVVNAAASRAEAADTFRRVSSAAANFLGLTLADGGYIVQDTHVPLAVRQRCPFVLRYPRCPASVCIGSTASRLVQWRGGGTRRGDFFRRVVELFV